jgi:hypothetical protein
LTEAVSWDHAHKPSQNTRRVDTPIRPHADPLDFTRLIRIVRTQYPALKRKEFLQR